MGEKESILSITQDLFIIDRYMSLAREKKKTLHK